MYKTIKSDKNHTSTVSENSKSKTDIFLIEKTFKIITSHLHTYMKLVRYVFM